MKLINYLQENYKPNTPIFINEIDLDNITNVNIRKNMSRLHKENVIVRYSQGVYYIPTMTQIGLSTLTVDSVIEKKYIKNNNKIYEYYSGLTFANKIGVFTQVPAIREIVTNKEQSNRRSVTEKYTKIILRKPYVKVTNDNYKILQFLDFINKFEIILITDNYNLLKKYIIINKFTKKKLLDVLFKYPNKVSSKLVESELLYVFA